MAAADLPLERPSRSGALTINMCKAGVLVYGHIEILRGMVMYFGRTTRKSPALRARCPSGSVNPSSVQDAHVATLYYHRNIAGVPPLIPVRDAHAPPMRCLYIIHHERTAPRSPRGGCISRPRNLAEPLISFLPFSNVGCLSRDVLWQFTHSI